MAAVFIVTPSQSYGVRIEMTSYCLKTGYRDRPFAFFWDAVGLCDQNCNWGNRGDIIMRDWVFSFMAIMHNQVWEVNE